ncbi:MAG: alpha/beta hydrolase [Stellaceae bacterium]
MHAPIDRRFPWIVLLMMALAGCGPDASLHKAEKQLGVETTWYDSDLRIWHSALFKPRGEGLRSPGYVLGIEKVHPAAAIPARLNGTPLPRDTGFYITHVVRYDVIAGGGKASSPMSTSCALFTMIDTEPHAVGSGAADADSARHVFDLCANARLTRVSGASDSSGAPADLTPNAFTALDIDLPEFLRSGQFTDIIVMVMGWNTEEEQALNNFSALAGHMMDEAQRLGEDFHPLVIGVSWPSEWQLDDWSVVPDAVVRGLSFPFKAVEADEVGTHVISYVVQEILEIRQAQAKPLRVVLLGHSFGARALVNAVKAIEPAAPAHFNDQDRLILFEGAFEIYTLFTDSADKFRDDAGTLDEHFGSGKPRLTLTSSYYDSAVSAAIWGRYAGDVATFNDVCRENSQVWTPFLRHPLTVSQIGCAFPGKDDDKSPYGLRNCGSKNLSDYDPKLPNRSLYEEPQPGGPPDPKKSKPVRYFDASYMINCNEPFTGGGAHSDIFRDETARFLLDEIAR